MRRRLRRRTTRTLLTDIPLTPLIDTALTLLIIFMVTTPMLNNAIKVDLPQGNAQEASSVQQELVVYVDKNEKIYFNGSPVKMEQLLTDVQKAVASHKNQVVFVKADQGVRYGYVLDIVDQIKFVENVQSVALATKKRGNA